MKVSLICLACLAIVTFCALPNPVHAGCGQGRGGGGGGSCAVGETPREDLSDAETASLLLMREEEKLARDVYLTLGEQYELNVFVNIPRAEQRHLDRVGELLAKYAIADPIGDDTVGSFQNQKLQKLYHELVAKGATSVTAALQVGATIEDLDLFDLETALRDVVDSDDIRQVYLNLAKGSRNHMRAFTSQLAAHDVTYQAQYISGEDYEAIVNSAWERGPVSMGDSETRGQGRGRGRGQGRGRCGNRG